MSDIGHSLDGTNSGTTDHGRRRYFDTSTITPGMMFMEHFTVSEEWTALSMGSGDVPVLSTPALILACEKTAYRGLQHLLGEDFTSVGSKVEILHTAPSRVGDRFRVEAMISQVRRNFITFTITVFSDTRTIATGLHRRHIVCRDSFIRRLESKDSRNLR